MFLNSRKISVVLRIFEKSKSKRFNCWFSLIDFRHWLKIRTYSNLRNCSCFLGTLDGLFFIYYHSPVNQDGRRRRVQRFLLNRRFTTFALTSALEKVISLQFPESYLKFFELWRLPSSVQSSPFQGKIENFSKEVEERLFWKTCELKND